VKGIITANVERARRPLDDSTALDGLLQPEALTRPRASVTPPKSEI
jgi:hypothetical protein